MALAGGEAEPQSHKYELIISFGSPHGNKANLVWLNGGPGCSSLAGLSGENGPLRFPSNSFFPRRNPYSWTKLANILYIDQPIGTGFSIGRTPRNNSEVTEQLYQWLKGFYEEFPELRSKNTVLAGESFAAIHVSWMRLRTLIF